MARAMSGLPEAVILPRQLDGDADRLRPQQLEQLLAQARVVDAARAVAPPAGLRPQRAVRLLPRRPAAALRRLPLVQLMRT